MILGVLVALALVAGTATAATIPVSGERSGLTLASESSSELTFHVEIGALEALDVSTKGGDFTRLLIPGFHASKIEGQPELPMLNRLIAIPMGAQTQVEVRNVQTRLVNLADYGITNPVFPAQPSMSKSATPDEVPFVMDRAAYQGEIRRELAQVQYQGRLRAMDMGRLEISPVAYYPSTGQLEIVESMDVSVTFPGANSALQEDLIARTYSPFFEHHYASIAGSRAFQDDYPDRVNDPVTMVIVTPPMFAGQLAEFVEWKTERGFYVITAVTGTPEVGSTNTEIQSYLHGLYNAATPEMPAPSFVLFVGDVAQMPTFTLGGDATDRPYCAVDGDLVPDMYYGRFSATNPSELQAQLDKTLTYDEFTMADPSYLGNVTMIAGVDSGWAPSHGNGQINYGTEHYFNASHGIYSNTFLYPASDAPGAPAAIVATADEGVGYINYTAHGSQTSWSDPSFTQSNINGLTNEGKYFLAVGNCCLTSTYDYGECFGETFLRAENKGAVGYIGGSNSTYWDEDYWWGVGFHASSQIDGTAWPVESTGIGVYDGVFHDHGEAEHLWYVTNGAVVFSGNLAVMEAGSSRIEYYWNIYNLLGDPSLSNYMGVPEDQFVGHPETVFVGNPSMNITAVHGSYVGLTQDGVLVGSGAVGESGSLDVEFTQLLTPGVPMKMVVMAQNKVPYIVDLNVIVPATVTIDPMVIDANVATDITVTVMDADGVVPQPGINIWAEGLDYSIAPVATDANGVAVINVNYAYGPTLDIVGQDPNETYRLFTEPVTVNALSLTAPDLTVSTDIGLVDAFALNLPGTLHATVGEPGHTLFAELPDGTVLDTAASELTLTPDQLGVVNGIIAVSGYDVYSEAFDIIEAYGTLAGVVTNEGAPMGGVVVNCLDEFGSNVFSAVTDGAGNYASPEEILVDDYSIVVDHFGYLHFEETTFVNYGANTFDIALVSAPSGVLTGTVIDAVTYEGLQATVRVYRTDTGELYTETLCDEDGVYTTSALPYFTYEFRVRAYQHVPATLVMDIDQPETIKNFALEQTNGDLLIIDDSGAAGPVAAKMGGKYGNELLADAYVSDSSKSATQMKSDLEEMGFFVTQEDAGTVDVNSFWDYDLVMLACSDNISTLSNSSLKAALVAFAQEGGHILLEGGELGYNWDSDDAFATHVMHSDDWVTDSAGNITVHDNEAYILNNPNPACAPITITYSGYGDSDAMAPLPDAEMPLSWSGNPTDASMITYDPNPAPEGGQIVFFCFNYLAADMGRYALLENAVHWLLTPEIGDASVSGQAMLLGEDDHAGITITAIPNGGTTVTAADGTYSLPGLYAGTYTIRASKLGWTTEVEEVTLVSGQDLTDVNFVLNMTYEDEVCGDPALPIGDNQTVSDSITMMTAGEISEVSVYVDITHTYQGDLILTLTSPEGTDVVLHNRSGGSADNIVGWYPGDFEPAGDLGVLTGEEMSGDWTLTISDNAGGDIGVFNSWCVHVVYDGGVVSTVDDSNPSVELPTVFALRDNYPNPFNPLTTIKFDLPRASHVKLVVYDIAGRLVQTLVDEQRGAAVHTVSWDGTDRTGRRVASRPYYYQVVTDTEIATRKMMLVK